MPVANNTKTASQQATESKAPSVSFEETLDKFTRSSQLLSISYGPEGASTVTTLSPVARRMHTTSASLANGLSYLQVQNGALRVLRGVLDRVEALRDLALDPGKTADDVASFNAEYDALKKKISSVTEAKYNGHEVFGAVEHALEEVRFSEVAINAASIDLAKVRAVAEARDLQSLDKNALRRALSDVSAWRVANENNQSRIAGAAATLAANRQFSASTESSLSSPEAAGGAVRYSVQDVLGRSSRELVSRDRQNTRRILQLIEG